MDALMMPGRPGLLVQVRAAADPADTLFQKAYGERLVRHLAQAFPEYGARFGTVTVKAVNPGDRRTWTGVYRLPGAGDP
jgi:hypothetical protein